MVTLSASLVNGAMVAQDKPDGRKDAETKAAVATPQGDSATDGSVTVGGQAIAYRAVAGVLTVGSTDAQDAMLGLDGKYLPDSGIDLPGKPEDQPATARMFYTAYFKKGAQAASRPITFLYNGGPGSATMYLHMGAFGPKRIVTPDGQHQAAAPYPLVENQYSLLDVSDLVFIDAPGAGFSRVMGKDAGKAFFGTDEDAHAFDRFIRRFLTKYSRWNSPKYIFGESYGTTRSAVLSRMLQGVDLNGVVLLSQILSFDNSADGPEGNPGTDQPYFLSLPSMAATAWYHHRVPNQTAQLEPFLREVEQFSLGEYASALLQGADLSADRKKAIADKLQGYTGVPAAYWMKANLRVSGGDYSKELQSEEGLTTGRLDTRYQGPDMDRLSKEAEYDPFTNSITAAYVTAINQYAREELKYGENMTYKPSARQPGWHWNLAHVPPGGQGWESSVNVMTDLAVAMKRNPKIKVMLMGGYFDLGTLYFGATYEMKHLPMPQSLQSNISYHWFQTGHMVYVNESALKELHEQTAAFIRENSGVK
ncbi:S10 family peptidase [Occallatibacter riparius]|uniref:Peptidase S10 n=1 Tax=Occallatibacter riparius TaxID=1002689 RepID=A0A9J7BJ79_9BACT|nr:peptidase S10 [Occallatibacter riparius]UWZ82880.1 peptidase S10 [Occallatibacter riparius]